MEAAISLMGVALTTLAMVLAYIWRTNGRMMESFERVIEGLGRLQGGQETLQEALQGGLERLQGGLERLQSGLQALQAGQEALQAGQENIAKLVGDADRRRAEDTRYLAELMARISRP